MVKRAKFRYLLRITPRDCDTPGFFDLRLNLVMLQRALAHNDSFDRLCSRNREVSRHDVLLEHVPGAYRSPSTGEVEIDAGYDPAYNAGRPEQAIWRLVCQEVAQELRT